MALGCGHAQSSADIKEAAVFTETEEQTAMEQPTASAAESETTAWADRSAETETVDIAGDIDTEMLEIPAVTKDDKQGRAADEVEKETTETAALEEETTKAVTEAAAAEETTTEAATEAATEEMTTEAATEAATEEMTAEAATEAAASVETQQAQAAENELEWYLLLVNRSHPLTEEYRPQTRPIGYYGIPVDVRIYDALKAMLDEGNRQGCSLLVCSGYRPYERQVELYEQDVAKYMRWGYSYEKACELTEETLLPPGTSEHQAGLAADIVATTRQVLDSGFENTTEGRWLAAHAHEYGFILRYPKDKVEITQIEYEPWHFRYVGAEAAAEIHELGCCLEEYIDILRERMANDEALTETLPEATESETGTVTEETAMPEETAVPEETEPETAEEETGALEAAEPETTEVVTQPETAAEAGQE